MTVNITVHFCRQEYNKMVLRKKINMRKGYNYDEYL